MHAISLFPEPDEFHFQILLGLQKIFSARENIPVLIFSPPAVFFI
jgi:hypothetical protein